MENNDPPQNISYPESVYLPKHDYLRFINQAVIITDLDGKINFWNKAAIEIYGWTDQEAVGKNIADIILTQQTKEQAIEIMNQLSQGQSWSGEFIVQRKNGECFPAFVTDLPYYNDHNKLSGVIGISTDLTAQKKAEREIKLLLNNTEESFILLDPLLNIVSFNKQAYDLYHKHIGRVLINGLPILQFADPSRVAELKKDYQKILAGNIHESALTFTDKEGNENTFALKYTPAKDERNTIIGIFIAIREITEQKKAEAALIANEAKWHALVENIHDIFMIVDNDGLVKYVSPAITKVLKYEGLELMENHLTDLFHAADKKLITDTFSSALNQPGIQQLSGRTRIKCKTGESICVEGCITNLLHHKEIRGIVYTAWDVTELVKGEVTLKAEQANKEALINATDDFIWSINESYELVAANTAFLKALKQSAGTNVEPGDSLIQKDKFTKDFLTFWQSLYSRAFAGEAFKKEIYTAETANINAVTWAEVSFNPIVQNNKVTGIACLSRDITRQKQDAIALQQNQARMQGLIASQTNYVIRTDLEGRYTYYNDKFFEDFGWTHKMENLIGMSGLESIMPYHHEIVSNTVNKCFAEPNKVFQVELDKPFLNGAIKSTFWDFICLTNLQGNPVEIQCVGIDITERVSAEKELKRKVEELAVSNKELEHFAFVASHDLQEPLRMVTRFLTQLKKNYEGALDERANDYIRFAVDGAVRMRQIILDLLEYSRVGRLKQPVENVDTNEVVEEVILLIQKKIEELDAKIIFSNLPVVRTHRSPMRQLLQNLVMNALKFTRPGIPPRIEITASDNSTQWIFAVKDNGIGIDKDYFDKIFILFQRLHNREEYTGSGIGLSIAKKIVETMGGNIWVESTEGQGSTFFFTVEKI